MASEIHGYIGDYKITNEKTPALFERYGVGSSLSMEWRGDSDGVGCESLAVEQADGTVHEFDEREIDALPSDVLADINRIVVNAAAKHRWNNGLMHQGYGR